MCQHLIRQVKTKLGLSISLINAMEGSDFADLHPLFLLMPHSV